MSQGNGNGKMSRTAAPLNKADIRVIVKFIVAATGYRRLDASLLFQQVPDDLRTRLFLLARSWEQETQFKASNVFVEFNEIHGNKLGLRDTKLKARRAHAGDPPPNSKQADRRQQRVG